jgi:glycine betaine/proline transport system permease protein
VRPINDTMQTMPLFVILIPFVMVFKIGEFTGLLAIIAYAFVPAIRYAEHGLRNLPETVIEAGNMMGATQWQLLWQVKIPLALPVMMLGLNQTIMYAIAMLVIAALVGTNGLEQIVYIGLSDGDFGIGIVAGLCMAIIAIIADRMTQGWSKKRQAELGLDVQ